MSCRITKEQISNAFAAMGKDAQETALGMIEYCIRTGAGMGMDEGLRKDDKPRAFRKQLEKFVELLPR
jgi:hypothetical protein